MRLASGSCLLLLALPSCLALPDLQADSCGNGVIDEHENCDGYGVGEAQCRPPGDAYACHLDCSARADGTHAACPAGFGCDAFGVCRAATGDYSEPGEPIPGNADTLFAADFDGDGRDDVLSQQPTSAHGATTFRVQYFDRGGEPAGAWASPSTLVSLSLADLTPDGRADVVFTDGRIGMLLGQSDRTLISETYPSYVLDGARARLLAPLFDNGVSDTTPLLVLAERDGLISVLHPDPSSASLEPYGDAVPGTLDSLAGEPALGHVFSDPLRYPCNDVVLARRGATDFAIDSVCERASANAPPTWRAQRSETRVALDPPAGIESGPLLADVDGDGHTDVLVGAAGVLYVAFGDGQQLTAAKPWRAPRTDAHGDPGTDLTLPLAAGDINGDGAADFVYPSDFALSSRGDDRSGVRYHTYPVRLGTAWTSARIADLNGNGLPDVIAAADDRVDIDFFNGTGSDRMNPFVVPTDRPVQQLAIGDYDGDLILDVAYTQHGAGDDSDAVAIAFGSPSGAPREQTITAQASGMTQIGSLPYSGADVLGELFVVFDQQQSTGESSSAVAWFVSAGDRHLRCLVELTTFADDGSILSVPGLAITAGRFHAPDQLDVLLLGSNPDEPQPGFWLLPDLRTGRGRPESLGYPLGDQLRTVAYDGDDQRALLQLAAADLDGDGLDELVFTAPDADGGGCQLAIAHVGADADAHTLDVRQMLALDRPCADPQVLRLADVDRDGASDVLLLVAADGGGRELRALWNDGAGAFSSAAMSVLAPGSDVRAFAPLRRGPALAYVTQDSLHVLTSPRFAGADAGARDLLDARVAVALTRATGVTAADVDGDGVEDLVVADRGELRVLMAELLR